MESESHLRISIEAEYLNDVLSRARDLSHIKLVLHVVRLAELRGSLLVPVELLLDEDVVRTVAGPNSPLPAEQRVRQGIESALADGFLLRFTSGQARSGMTYLVPATSLGKQLVDRVRGGELEEDDLDWLGRGPYAVYRPNVFALYERYIGPLTPLVAEQLRDAERSYPRRWIEEAMRAAVDANKQNWRYVQSILNRWASEGAPDLTNSRA